MNLKWVHILKLKGWTCWNFKNSATYNAKTWTTSLSLPLVIIIKSIKFLSSNWNKNWQIPKKIFLFIPSKIFSRIHHSCRIHMLILQHISKGQFSIYFFYTCVYIFFMNAFLTNWCSRACIFSRNKKYQISNEESENSTQKNIHGLCVICITCNAYKLWVNQSIYTSSSSPCIILHTL